MKTNRIVRAWIWLRRIGHCRGFGIQSPWAYSLVRYVINEHYPYYAYERLAKDFPEADAVRRKMGEFFLRLANNAPAIDAEWLTEAVKRLRTGDFVVVDRLNYNKAVWQDVVGRLQNIVSFDMYYCGLVYVDPKRYKQNYKINF